MLVVPSVVEEELLFWATFLAISFLQAFGWSLQACAGRVWSQLKSVASF